MTQNGKLRIHFLLWSLLGALSACGPTASDELTPPDTAGPASSLPFDVQDVLRRARTGSPAMGPSQATIFPELQVSPHPVGAGEPAVAVGNGVYLVLWTEPGFLTQALLGVRIRASDGVVLDAAPLSLSTTSYTQSWAPAVAFDGTTFLVVFTRMAKYGTDVCTQRVRASDGAVLDTYPVCIGTSPSNKNPSVAFDGTNYVVAWWGWYSPGNAPSTYTVVANWVRPSDGKPVLSSPIGIRAAPQETHPQVAADNGHILVAWEQSQQGQGLNVLGARIDAVSKTLLDPTPLPIAVGTQDEGSPTVAASANQFLVVWNDGGNLKGTRVRSSDGALLDGVGFQVAGPGATPASATFDGSDYRMAWQAAPAGARGLFSRPVSTQGTLGSELLLSAVHPSTSWSDVTSIAAEAPGKFLVAYPQFDAQQGSDRIKARRVNAGRVCEEAAPTLAINGVAEPTLECEAGGLYGDQGARAFDGCGNPLQVHASNTGTDSSGPGPLLSQEGTYTVSYAAWDAAGRTVSASRIVHVDDTRGPLLSLNGATYVTHPCGSEWVDPGVEAQDQCYGNLTAQVVRTGEVDGWNEGTYIVTYSLTDSGGNSAAPVTRFVEVTRCFW